jgi:serine protease
MFSGTGARGVLAVCRCGPIIALALLCSFVRSASARQQPVVSALAQSHPYRHGVVPMLGQLSGSRPRSASTGNLVYKGGIGGVGVVTGAPRVYLVFWGSQWGSQATNSQGDVTLSGDPVAMAPHLQEFMKGLGTGGETWSGVMTQYCQGISTGTQTCPIGATHVGYPTGGVLAGVWVDESSPAPAQATGHEIGLEAVSAATHFANTTPTANGSAQYVIVSPPGAHPDGFKTSGVQFCAWHDYTGDSTLSGGAVSSPAGQLAFTNLPYVTDSGTSCGQGFVNPGSTGVLDGVTIVEGHEYAETITDPYPSTGWVDGSGLENGDKCAWVKLGQGASQNVTLSTGTFAVQATWSNDYNGGSGGCQTAHPMMGT